MQRQEQTSIVSASSLFHDVIQLAKDKNIDKLQRLVNDGYCINPLQGNFRPINLLAKDGHTEAVELLIVKFNINLNHAIFGYAIGNHKVLVDDLLNRGASLKAAIEGYALGCHHASVDELIQRDNSLCQYAVRGYACAGDREKVEAMIQQSTANGLDLQKTLDYTVFYYAIGNHYNLVDDLINRGASIDDAAQGYARNIDQNKTKINSLIARGANINSVMYGYTNSGRTENLLSIVTSEVTPDIKYEIMGYAAGGHTTLLNKDKYLNHVKFNESVARAFVLANHIEMIEPFLTIKKIGNAFNGKELDNYFANEKITLRTLTLINDHDLRSKMADIAKSYCKSLPIKKLLADAKIYNQLIKELNITFDDALIYRKAWSKREFHILCLQGAQLVKNNQIPLEILIHIMSYVIELPNKVTNDVFNKQLTSVPIKIRVAAIKQCIKKFENVRTGFFNNKSKIDNAKNELESKLLTLDENCNKRLGFN